MSKLKKELWSMLITGALYLMSKVLEVKVPEYEKVWLILQAVTLIAFGVSVICLMINSTKK